MNSSVRAPAWFSLGLALALAGQAAAMEVSSPGGPPTLSVQVPDSAVVLGEKKNTVFLVEHQLPYLVINVEAGDVKGLMQGNTGDLDQVAANVFDGIQQTGQTTTTPTAAGRTTLAGHAAYIYKGVMTRKDGLRADIELWLAPLDDTHVGIIVAAGTLGDPSMSSIEQIVAKVTLSTR